MAEVRGSFNQFSDSGSKGVTGLVNPWVDILVFIVAGLSFPLVNMGVSVLLRRNFPYDAKRDPYESGEEPFGDARVHFHLHYYFYAILFLAFDVEVVFLYPWALVLKEIGWFAYVVMFLFIMTLVEGLLYAYKKGVLKWT